MIIITLLLFDKLYKNNTVTKQGYVVQQLRKTIETRTSRDTYCIAGVKNMMI